MKAKEYAQQILDSKFSEQAACDMVRDLMGEIQTLIKTRGCQTDSSINSVLREVDQKYKAICRIVNKTEGSFLLKEDGMKQMLLLTYINHPTIIATLPYFH